MTAWLQERAATVNGDSPLKVDRDRGIIYGVKLVGFESPNSHRVPGVKRTRYLREALKAAIPLYENADVYISHRDKNKPKGDRPLRDKLGKVRNIRMEPEGLRGDLYYNRANPLSADVLEDVERGLGMYSMSHDAKGHGEVRDDEFVIDQILEVRSVDLVDRGATNANLWESREPNTMATTTFRALLQSAWLNAGRKSGRRRVIAELLEMEYMDDEKNAVKDVKEADDDPMGDVGAGADAMPPEGDIPPAEPTPLGDVPVDMPAETDPDAALEAGFTAACVAVVQDKSLDAKGKIGRLKQLIMAQEKLLSAPAEAAPVAESDHEEEEEPETEKEVKESLEDGKSRLSATERAELKQLRAERHIRDLCESKQFTPSPVQLKAMANLQESDRAEFIDDLKQRTRPAGNAGQTTAFRSTATERLSDADWKSRVLVTSN